MRNEEVEAVAGEIRRKLNFWRPGLPLSTFSCLSTRFEAETPSVNSIHIMPPKNSIFRGPEAQHFQLVHRSQRDPLINDTEASQRVLKPVGRGNDRKAKVSSDHRICDSRC